VEDVIYQKDLTDAVNRNLQRISYILLVLAVLLTMVSTALINNTIKLSVHAGRFVIRTMMLIGADWGVIRRPFMWRSFRLGCFSACCACAVLWLSVAVLLHHDATLQPYITTNMMLQVSGVVLTFGLLLTCCSTYFSVNGFLKRKASELY
jgi:cell division transport system permease protein